MPDRLLIRLDAAGHLTWLAQAADGRVQSGASVGAPPAPTLAQARRVVVVVPADEILLLEAPAVAKNRSQLEKAVPYAVEDQLAQPVEDMHFALAQPADGKVGVAAVARTTLAGWLDRLAQEGIRPDVVVPDALALQPGTLLIESAHSVLRFAPFGAASMDTPALVEWLGLFGDGMPPTQVYDTRLAPKLDLPLAVAHYHERVADPLVLLAHGLRGDPPIDLLQGAYAPRHRHAPARRLWRLAGGLAAAAVLLAFVHAIADRVSLQRRSDRLEAQMRELLVQNFPEMEKVGGDPAVLMKSQLQRLGGGAQESALLRMLGHIAPIIGGTTRLTTRGLEFRNGTLELAVTAPDVPTLDSIRERLATVPGLKVELTAASPGPDGFEGRLRVSGGGS